MLSLFSKNKKFVEAAFNSTENSNLAGENPSAIPVSMSSNQFEQWELTKKRQLIRNCSFLIIAAQLADSVMKIDPMHPHPWNNWLFDLPIIIAGFCISILLKKNQLRLAAWVEVLIYFCSVINNYLQFGTDVPLIIGFMIPILLAATLLNKWEVLIISTLSFGFTIGLYICQDGLHIFKPILNSTKSQLVSYTIPLLLALLPTTWFVLLSYIHDRSRRFQLQREWWQTALDEINKKNQQISATLEELQLQRARELDLHRAIIRASERERVSLARNLHDDPLQQLQELSRQLGQLATTNPQLLNLQESTKQTARKLRAICSNLRPDILENFGLYEALLDLVNDIEKNGKAPNTQLHLAVPLVLQELRFSPEVETTFYRVAQEALQNAIKHAQATTITIELNYQDAADHSKIVLTIKDNGNGFELPSDLRKLAALGHYGLIGFLERASQYVGGQLTILSNSQQGTTIKISLPAEPIVDEVDLIVANISTLL